MKCLYACQSAEHVVSRRSFVGGLAAGAAGVASGLGAALAGAPAIAEQIKAKQRRVANIFMHRGGSQPGRWDPKPNTHPRGPLRAIPRSRPGLARSRDYALTPKQ